MNYLDLWPLERLVEFAVEVCQYAIDHHRHGEGLEPHWHGCDGPEDGNHLIAWRELNTTSYVLACITAQHTPLGPTGVETEAPFHALRMWEPMSDKKRTALAKAYFQSWGTSCRP